MGLASFALSIEDLMTSWKHEVLVPKLHLLNLVSKLKTASGEEGILIRFYTRRLMWCSNANYNAIPRNTSGYLSQWNVDCLYEVQSFPSVSTVFPLHIYDRYFIVSQSAVYNPCRLLSTWLKPLPDFIGGLLSAGSKEVTDQIFSTVFSLYENNHLHFPVSLNSGSLRLDSLSAYVTWWSRLYLT